MSAERKTVEEKLKRDKDALPLEEMTLAEVGMDIPYELAAGGRWLPTDRINTRKRVFTEGKPHDTTILYEAINKGFLDYVLALIGTFRRKDKIGLNPNIVGTTLSGNTVFCDFPIKVIFNLYMQDPQPSLALLISEIIHAGANLSFAKNFELIKLNANAWNLPPTESFSKMITPLDMMINVERFKDTFRAYKDMPPVFYTETPITKQFFVLLQFFTEDPIRDKPEVQTKEKFKQAVDNSIPASQKMPSDIFNLICEYLPFTQKLNLEETINIFKKPDEMIYRKPLLERLPDFLRGQFKEYQKEQRILQKLEVSRMEEEELQKERQQMARLPSEIRTLKAMVADQSVMIRKQNEQLAVLTLMVKHLMKDRVTKECTSATQDRSTSAASVLSEIPAIDAFSEQFEIEVDTTSARKRKQKVLIPKAKSSNP